MPAVVKGTNYMVGHEWRSPMIDADGHQKVLLKILKITDGTADTTFTKHVYGRYNYQAGMFERDKDGRVPVITVNHYLEGNPDFKAQELLKKYKMMPPPDDLEPDRDDVFVYFVKDPVYDIRAVKGKPMEDFKSGHGKCTHEKFLEIVIEIEDRIAKEKLEVEVANREKDTQIAALAADAIVKKVEQAKTATKKK